LRGKNGREKRWSRPFRPTFLKGMAPNFLGMQQESWDFCLNYLGTTKPIIKRADSEKAGPLESAVPSRLEKGRETSTTKRHCFYPQKRKKRPIFGGEGQQKVERKSRQGEHLRKKPELCRGVLGNICLSPGRHEEEFPRLWYSGEGETRGNSRRERSSTKNNVPYV